MRLRFFSWVVTSPFGDLLEHAEKVKECVWVFQQAMECYVTEDCDRFDELREEVSGLETEADTIKRRIRSELPKGTLLPVDKFQLFQYLREQDHVLDAVEESLDWISFRSQHQIPKQLEKELFLLVDSIIDPIEELRTMVSEASKYFRKYSDKQRSRVMEIIRTLRQQGREADRAEDALKKKVFELAVDPVTVFHTVRMAEAIGAIADHAQNAGDMMLAMIAR